MRNQVSLTAPVIAIYSRRDAVVAWEACIDRITPNVEHVEVRTTHLGFGFSPDVYKIIARRLAPSHSPVQLADPSETAAVADLQLQPLPAALNASVDYSPLQKKP